ncbi:uncharacterized protein LOC104582380 [Brachypodium distachyon]|uniref:uncharacterized protein LOC104582380 n=1 Tax=Brachypodium distachyon TaxID=15368 RepID=UPI0001C76D9B|nr:uncharacterized protein LOC104582380 [Brachypodium distachyon]|eukprot:XP_010230178.2 uncharacterized protein LOC104582380 [Brachypodium distachyon]
MASCVGYFPNPSPSLSCRPSYSTTLLSAGSQPFRPRRIMVRWQPPRAGWFKLNFDGSVYHDGSGRASIGGAIRDCNGRVLAAFAERTEHSTVGIVEARAMIRGLRLALGCFLGRLVVEGDDLVLVQLLRGEETQTRIPLPMQEEILGLLARFSACEVQHIHREGNQVAHVLCQQAYHRPGVWMGGLVPRAAWEKAEDDLHGVAHERLCKTKAMAC